MLAYQMVSQRSGLVVHVTCFFNPGDTQKDRMTLTSPKKWHLYIGVSKIGVKPPKWMVKIIENPIKMDDLGVHLFLETSI